MPNKKPKTRDAKPVSSIQQVSTHDGTTYGPNEIPTWDTFAACAIIGWLSRGVLGANDDLASECAVFADLMMKERAKRFLLK